MSDTATGGFKLKPAIGSGQETKYRKQTTDYTLTGEVRQKTKGQESAQVWNTSSFLRDAHKPTGERHVSGAVRAFRVLLAGSPDTQTTHENEHHTTGGGIDA